MVSGTLGGRSLPDAARRGTSIALCIAVIVAAIAAPHAADAGPVPGGQILRVHVPEAIGGKTVIGQLTVDRATDRGHVTAFPCDEGFPTGPSGQVTRSDVNYDPRIDPATSNRLIVKADDDGDICFLTYTTVELVVDVNGVSFDRGISSFPNRRTDTRTGTPAPPGAGGTLAIHVPEATGGKTVIGQLTVDRATDRGHVTAYPCNAGLPTGTTTTRSDLNYNGTVTPATSNRLIVQADHDGNICITPLTAVHLVVDINGTTDTGISSFPNRRTDTRTGTPAPPGAGGTLAIHVPEATGGKTVIGQLTVDRATDRGHVTAYPCNAGLPTGTTTTRSDLNYNGTVTPATSNRLIVQADHDGNICITPLTAVHLVVDINGTADDTGIFSFPNRRTDTRSGTTVTEWPTPPLVNGVPVWPPYTPRAGLPGTAALTGHPVAAEVAARPVVAVKVDNYRLARPHWGLGLADAVFEVEVEGVSRFIALFQSSLPVALGPVRSARTGDLDLLTGMNRPVFAFSGANPGVTNWVETAHRAGVLVDFSALTHGCYGRRSDRPGPHNLSVDTTCAVSQSPSAGAAVPLWSIADGWVPPPGVSSTPDTTFNVPMAGVTVGWAWSAAHARYLRTQDGQPHLVEQGPGATQVAASTVVEVRATYQNSIVDERSPHVVSVGSGAAVVHRDGRAFPATWTRASPYEPFVFRSGGVEIPLDVGVTYIEMTRG